MTDLSRWFVSTEWLDRHLDSPDVVVDGSWHLATTGRNAEGEYRAAHIPGAVDIEEHRAGNMCCPVFAFGIPPGRGEMPTAVDDDIGTVEMAVEPFGRDEPAGKVGHVSSRPAA